MLAESSLVLALLEFAEWQTWFKALEGLEENEETASGKPHVQVPVSEPEPVEYRTERVVARAKKWWGRCKENALHIHVRRKTVESRERRL